MDAVQSLIIKLREEVKVLVKSAIEIAYFSRGSWDYDRVLLWSPAEREIAVEFIQERLEIAKKSPFPVY